MTPDGSEDIATGQPGDAPDDAPETAAEAGSEPEDGATQDSPTADPDSPTAAPDSPTAAEACDGAEADGLASARVLVIDDEAPVVNFLVEALRVHGIEPVVATDGAAGLAAFLETPPDLIFCDLLIPKRNGFQLIEDFRRGAPDVPVVAMSGIYRRERYADELAHAQLFACKPLDLMHVQEAVGLLRRHLQARSERPQGTAEPQRAPSRERTREPWVPLSVLPLPRMLHLLWNDRRTGLLTLRAQERQVVFMLDEGRLQFVRTNDPELRLDRVLLQLGRVTPAQLQRAEGELQARTTPTRLGEVLVEQGTLTQGELDRAIQVQLRRIVASAFGETAGETLFRAETLPPGEDVVIDSDLRAVIVAGCLSVRDHGDRLLGHLPDGACTVGIPADGLDPELRLPLAVARLLEAVEEPTRLSDLVAMADLVGMRGRWLVFGLLCADALVISGSTSAWRGIAARQGDDETLAGVPLEVMLELEAAKATGVLHATWGHVGAWLALESGRIVQGGSSDARTRIGGLLRTAGLVTPEQLEGALREQASRPGRPLGHVLVEMGLLSAQALRTAVPAQVACVAREIMARAAWDEARFCPGESPEREPIGLTDSTTEIVLQTLREMDEKDLFDVVQALAPGRDTLDLARLRDGRFELAEGEEMVADALSTDTAHLIEALTSSERMDVEVLRVLCMALLSTEPAGVEMEDMDCAVIEVAD